MSHWHTLQHSDIARHYDAFSVNSQQHMTNIACNGCNSKQQFSAHATTCRDEQQKLCLQTSIRSLQRCMKASTCAKMLLWSRVQPTDENLWWMADVYAYTVGQCSIAVRKTRMTKSPSTRWDTEKTMNCRRNRAWEYYSRCSMPRLHYLNTKSNPDPNLLFLYHIESPAIFILS